MSSFTIELGAEVKEIVTGFVGTVTGRAEYIAGCRQYSLTPKAKSDGTLGSTEWFDEERLTPTGNSVSIPRSPTGGPGNSDRAPTRR